jgi:hypothetical protein
MLLLSEVIAYPINFSQKLSRVIASPLRPSQERVDIQDAGQLSNEIEAEGDEEKALQWKNLGRLLGFLTRNEQKRYNDAETEGIGSFFRNLGSKFHIFGKRVRHAFG